jgi:leader peptidase (prepilin peptidase) / N-methyltransferase
MLDAETAAELRWYFATLSFIFGTLVGSFLNVCIYRVPAQRSIVKPGSHCYHCGSPVRWHDNIPILSYLILRGCCRQCGTHFSSRYAWVELLTGLLFLAVFYQFGYSWAVPFHFAFVGLLIFGTFTDIDHFIISDSVTIGGLVFALVAAALLGMRSVVGDQWLLARDIYAPMQLTMERQAASAPHFAALPWAVAGAVFGWGMLAGVGALGRVLFRKEAMGGGDIKLFAFLGAYLGALNCVWILFLSAILGSCFGLTLILLHKLFGADEAEEMELVRDPAVKWHDGIVHSRQSRHAETDGLAPGETITTGSQLMEASVAPADDAPIALRIMRRSSRQMHHFPFGPYIAVAAVIVLLFSREINRFTREALLLPDLPAAAGSRAAATLPAP